MELKFGYLTFALLVAVARAEPPAPLADAVQKATGGAGHWAYTESTRISDDKGRDTGETIVRFDPSKPYPEQFTPVKVNGHEPTAKDKRGYRERGVKRGERLDKQAADEAAGKKDDAMRIEVNNDQAVIDFDHASDLGEAHGIVTYLVPLRAEGSHHLPVEKLQLTVKVNQADHTLVSATLRLLSSFRIMLVAKVKAGVLTLNWTPAVPNYPPLMTLEEGNLAASILFFHVNGWETIRRSDFERVTPYGDRFGVKIGPLKTLPF